jgi:hypothetical protein
MPMKSPLAKYTQRNENMLVGDSHDISWRIGRSNASLIAKKTYYRHIKSLFILLFFAALARFSFAQEINKIENDKSIRKEINKIRPRYLVAGTATGLMKLRDTGTSPRFYSGLVTGGGIGLYAEDSLRLTNVHADVGLAVLDDKGTIVINQWTGPTISISASSLWKLKSFREKNFQIGLGYSFKSFTMFRNNEALMNAGFGVDNFTSVGIGGGVVFPFERRLASSKKILFLHIRSQPRKYALAYQAHVPLVNLAARPGYAYLTNVVGPEITSFDTYNWSFGGYLLHMESTFTYYLHNGNAIRMRYAWAALGTSDTFALHIAQHTAGVVFMFRFNKINQNERN